MNPNTLDTRTQEVLTKILLKTPSDLTDTDIIFLQARRDYLNNQQKQFYADVLQKDVVVPSPESIEEVETKEEDKDEEDKVPYRDLQKQASALNIKAVGVPREELERAIETAQGPAGENQPE